MELMRSQRVTVNIALACQACGLLGTMCARALDCVYWGGKVLGALCGRASRTARIQALSTGSRKRVRIVAQAQSQNASSSAVRLNGQSLPCGKPDILNPSLIGTRDLVSIST